MASTQSPSPNPRSSKRRAPAKATQAERSEATQRKIIASALKLLQKEGFQKTNLQEIARGAKVTLGAVQHQFGTRQALMERLADEVMAPLADHGSVWPPDALTLPLAERAKDFVRRAWTHMYGPPTYLAAWSLFFGAKSEAPALFKRIDAHRTALDPLFFQHFLAIFPEVGDRYPSPQHLAAFVFSSLRGIAAMKLFKISEEEVEGELAVLADVIVMAGSRRAGA